MSTQWQYKSAVILSYLNIILGIVLSTVFQPFLLRAYGKYMQGVAATIGNLVTYVAVMDFGLGNAVIRYVAKYRAEHDPRGMERFLGMILALYLIIGSVIWIAGTACYLNLGNLFKHYTPEQMALAKKLFLLLLANMSMTMVLNVFPATLQGFERFVVVRAIAVIRLIVRSAILAFMLVRGTDPVQVAILDTALQAIIMMVYIAWVTLGLKVRIRWGGFDRPLLRTIFSYSFFIFLNMIMTLVYWNTDTMLASMLIGAGAATIVGYGGSMANYLISFSDAISGLFLPKSVQMVTRGASGEELTDVMIRMGRIQLMIVGLMVTGFGIVGYQFFTLMYTPSLSAAEVMQAYTIGIVLMAALVIPMFQNVAISITQAMNKHRFRAVALVFAAILNVIVSIVLIRMYGPIGAAIGTALALVLGNILLSNWYYHRKIGLNIPRFFRETLHGILPALLISIALGSLTFLMPQDRWLWLFARVVIILCIYAVAMWSLGMNASERQLVGGAISKVSHRSRARRDAM